VGVLVDRSKERFNLVEGHRVHEKLCGIEHHVRSGGGARRATTTTNQEEKERERRESERVGERERERVGEKERVGERGFKEVHNSKTHYTQHSPRGTD
jgi:hypothetical protein